MARLLLLASVIVLLVWAIRRKSVRLSRAGRGGAQRKIGPPERLLCGECGAEFDPEQSGWTCPRCHK